MTAIDPKLVEVRDIQHSDIPFILSTWRRSPRAFMEILGEPLSSITKDFDPEKFIKTKFKSKHQSPNKLCLLIQYKGKNIGFHSIKLTNPGSALFHALIFENQLRQKGIGTISYKKALEVFEDRFNLRKVMFHTSAENIRAKKIQEHLGATILNSTTGTSIEDEVSFVGNAVDTLDIVVVIYELIFEDIPDFLDLF